jgi:integrase
MSEKQAETFRLAKELELAGNVQVMHRLRISAAPTLAEFAEEYLVWYSQAFPDTHYDVEKRIRKVIVPGLGKYRIDSIPLQQAEMWKLNRGTQVAASAANNEIATLRAMLNKAVAWGKIQVSPLPTARFPNLPRAAKVKPTFATKAHMEALYLHAQTLEPHWAPIWKLYVNTGMRRTEALNLQWGDVQSELISIVSRTTARTKSGKSRDVPLNDGAREALDALRALTGGMRYVLPRVTRDYLTAKFRAQADAALLPPEIHLHSLRHTFASHLVMAGVSLREVQELLGHSTILMTEIYAHLAPGHTKKSVGLIQL